MIKHETELSTFLCKMLRTARLPKTQTNAIISTVETMRKNNGDEWTCNYFKSLSNNFLRQSAGLAKIQNGPFVRFSHHRNVVWRVINTTRDPLVLNTLLGIHKNIMSPKLTENQITKFCKSVTGPKSAVTTSLPDVGATKVVRQLAYKIGRLTPSSLDTRIPTFQALYYNGAPSIQPNEFRRFVAGTSTRGVVMDSISSGGNFRVSQEPGFKARFYAYGDSVVVGALKPLQQLLLETLSSVEQDCTHNQERGAEVIINWLDQGFTPVSLDLSNATDRFPRDYQGIVVKAACSILRSAGKPADDFEKYLSIVMGAESMRFAFKGSAEDKALLKQKGSNILRWEVGQPLGLPHSFPSFALAHHAVMQSLGVKEYLILGDDVVCKNAADAERYRDFMITTLGVEFSEQKSFVPPKQTTKSMQPWVVQFAGSTFIRTDDGHTRRYNPVHMHSWSKLTLIQQLERGLPERAVKTESSKSHLINFIRSCVAPSVGYTFRFTETKPLAVRQEGALTFNEIVARKRIESSENVEQRDLYSVVSAIAESIRYPGQALSINSEMSKSLDWSVPIPKFKPVDPLIQALRKHQLDTGIIVEALSEANHRLSVEIAVAIPEVETPLGPPVTQDGVEAGSEINSLKHLSGRLKAILCVLKDLHPVYLGNPSLPNSPFQSTPCKAVAMETIKRLTAREVGPCLSPLTLERNVEDSMDLG